MFSLKLSMISSVKTTQLAKRQMASVSRKALGFFKDKTNTETSEIAPIIEHDEDFDSEVRQNKIDSLRNKSGLLPQHRNILHGKVPYTQAESWVHNTLKYQRKIYGKFGESSELDPRICFWSPAELKEKTEYERVAFPKTVPEMMKINQTEKQERSDKISAREAQIVKNLEKLELWKKDIETRKNKKETDARVAKERKDRLIEEVRRHFGYTIDPRDERFKEMLEAKEKEQRKALKESKRQVKETKLMTKLMDTKAGKENSEDSVELETEETEKK